MGEPKHLFEQSWEFKGYRIINCQTCGFAHLDPIPTDLHLDEFYQEQYFREIKPFPYDSVTPEWIAAQKEAALKNNYYLNTLRRVAGYNTSGVKNILDIGCGNDLLTCLFKENGWQEIIVEPSKDAAEYLRKFGLSVFNQSAETIDELGLSDLSFINMEFVLEHIRDPLAVLQMLNQLMVPGGVIRICVPNDFSEGQLAYLGNYQEKPHWVCLPDHVNYFTFSSLSQLLYKTGFREVYRTTNFPLEFLLLGGMNYYASEAERAKVGPFIHNFEWSFWNTGKGGVLESLYESLAQQGLGRSIYIYAIKE